ncbi:MAG TPA: hypothetical protein PKH07_10230, partial [bacterium]|nr:hypothetical protein [bacterium]
MFVRMKTSYFLICFLVLCATAAQGARVPIQNAGFELDLNADGVPDGWNAFADTKKYDASAPERAHSGMASVRLAGNGYWQVISVAPGIPYLYRSWTRGQSGVENVSHSVDFHGTSGYLETTSQSSVTPSFYRQTGIWFRPIAEANRAALSSRTSRGDWVWQDDVEVFDGFLRNGSLEVKGNGDGVPDCWERKGAPFVIEEEMHRGILGDRHVSARRRESAGKEVVKHIVL